MVWVGRASKDETKRPARRIQNRAKRYDAGLKRCPRRRIGAGAAGQPVAGHGAAYEGAARARGGRGARGGACAAARAAAPPVLVPQHTLFAVLCSFVLCSFGHGWYATSCDGVILGEALLAARLHPARQERKEAEQREMDALRETVGRREREKARSPPAPPSCPARVASHPELSRCSSHAHVTAHAARAARVLAPSRADRAGRESCAHVLLAAGAVVLGPSAAHGAAAGCARCHRRAWHAKRG